MSEWSPLCPASCPPPSAKALDRSIFRFVKDPPKDTDWRTHAELGASIGADACLRCGYSCALELDAAREARDAIPRRRGNRIAQGNLPSGAAVYQQTGPQADHYPVRLRQTFHAAFPTYFTVLDA